MKAMSFKFYTFIEVMHQENCGGYLNIVSDLIFVLKGENGMIELQGKREEFWKYIVSSYII